MKRPIVGHYFAYALMLTLVGSLFSAALPVFQPSYASHTNIAFEIDHDVDEPYEEDDDVVIDGTIDNVDQNLDSVDITIRDSENDEVDSVNVELGSSDNFDMVFSVGGSDPDGVYEVEVEYDAESAFSYFIVDNDNDLIDVVLGETTYAGGDEVEIAGQVDDVVDGETEVEITVIDPNNDEIVDQDNAELGDGSLASDKFEYTFDLDNDADHGRYAVIVSYVGDDQQGFALFEIEDDDSGSGGDSTSDGDSGTDGDITAEIGEATYEPGDSVSLTGNIDNYNTNNELEIVVEDPDGVDIESDNDVSVQNDGEFDFDFDLDNDAVEGEYSVTLTYDTDELGLNFDVDEGTGTGGSTSTSLTAKLSKSSYLAGELVTITGTVPRIVEDDVVSVLLYRPDGTVVLPASQYVEPNTDKTYTASLRLDSDLDVEDEYSIKVGYDGKEVEVEFDITGQSTTTGAITVNTDKPTYQNGNTVRITGSVAEDLIVPTEDQVLLRINAPDKNPCRIDLENLASDGSYTYSLVLGGKCGLTGKYEVIAIYNQKDVKTTFTLEGGVSGTSYSLQAGGKTHIIEYEISGGTIKSMFVRPNDNMLVVSIAAEEDGQLTLVLPREVIDAAEGGKDISYLVATTDLEAGVNDDVDIEEDDSTDKARTIVIDYKAGTDLIEITGTTVVPEFGTIAAIVLAVSIVGIIVATTRYGSNGRFSLFRQ